MILRSYIDDSDIGQGAFSILAGWIGPADRWAAFTDDWQAALKKYGLHRFKMSEFLATGGEFRTWADEKKTFFIKYLVNLIRERAFKGIGVILPSAVYKNVFGKRAERPYNVPYFLLFFQLIAITLQRFDYYDVERIDFVFDNQPGQNQHVIAGWEQFKHAAPENLRCRLGDHPIFSSDENILPLQAADLYAGWIHEIVPYLAAGDAPPLPPWTGQEPSLDSYTDYFTEVGLKAAYSALTRVQLL